MEMMDYQQCLAYVIEHKLRTHRSYRTNRRGAWQVTDENGKNLIEEPYYSNAVNTYKAKYDAEDRQGDD